MQGHGQNMCLPAAVLAVAAARALLMFLRYCVSTLSSHDTRLRPSSRRAPWQVASTLGPLRRRRVKQR